MGLVGSQPSFTVSDFVAIFNQSLEVMYPQVVVVGELANFRISKGMWVYFDLKDDQASVRFFGTTRSLPGPLEDGMMLEVVGRPYLHPKFGFSVQVDIVQAVGAGSIKKAQDLLAAKLKAEGLFDLERKRELPFPPSKIGLITSVESAAYGDFTKIINARWPRLGVDIFNVQVQGQTAVEDIVKAIEDANQHPELEALIIIRGGGSRDDLAAFDHERIVRAVAASRIPTLVAVGHERDVSLAELAADQRASTPSNAAELLVPDRISEIRVLGSMKKHMDGLMRSRIEATRRELVRFREQLAESLNNNLSAARNYVEISGRLLTALDPGQPLKRGFALARAGDGKIIRTASSAKKTIDFSLEFSDETIPVKYNKNNG